MIFTGSLFGAMTLGKLTLNITIKKTLNLHDIQHHCIMTLDDESHIFYCYSQCYAEFHNTDCLHAECHNAECHYAECHIITYSSILSMISFTTV